MKETQELRTDLEHKQPRKYLPCKIPNSGDEGKHMAYAELVNSPEVAAYRVIGMMLPKSMSEELDIPSLVQVLKTNAEQVSQGDLTSAESMLVAQAFALQALFVRLSEKAMEQRYMPHLEGFMRLALRSQAQCRASLEALSSIKNPPVVYAKQANVTTGPQQVNNGVVSGPSPALDSKAQNQLSGGVNS